MPKYEIKKIGIWSLARTTGIIAVLSYLVGFCLFSICFLVALILQGGYYGYMTSSLIAWLVALPVGVLSAAIAGLAAGAITALVFNLLAPLLGGLDVEIEMKD